MNRFRERGVVAALPVALLCTVESTVVLAQTLDEIIVTARRREENLQEVPLSITAFSGQQLLELGAASDFDVADFTVNFNTLKQVGRDLDRPIIRGQAGSQVDGEPNAGYFVDGVYVSSTISTATLDAIERVEVLRGPQSAQFGRATFSGAVNYVTKQPTETFTGSLNTRAGTHDDYKVSGLFSGPLIGDRLLFLVSAGFDKYGGEWHNELEENQAYYQPVAGISEGTVATILPNPPQEANHDRLGGEETTDVLVKLLLRPWAGADLTLKYNYTRGEDDHVASLIFTDQNCFQPTDPAQPWYATSPGAFCGALHANGLVNSVNIPDFLRGVQVTPPFGESAEDWFAPPGRPGIVRDTHRYLVAYSQGFGDFLLTARAAYNQDQRDQGLDLDHQNVRALFGLFNFFTDVSRRDSSYEMRLATPQSASVRGEIGGYYFDYHERNYNRSIVGPGAFFGSLLFNPNDPPNPPATPVFHLARVSDIKNRAVFGLIEWDFAEGFTLAFEARYAKDEKDLAAASLDPVTGAPVTDATDTTSFTPRVTLREQITADAMVYVLAAKGNKPADFNTGLFQPNVCPEGPPGGPPGTKDFIATRESVIEEEEAWTYEAGAKTSWLDSRLTANLAVFYIDWDNLTVFDLDTTCAPGGGTNTTTVGRNAGTARSIGVELETSFALNEQLRVLANYGYADAEFRDARDQSTQFLTGNGDVSGNDIPNSPPHNYVLGLVAQAPLASGLTAFLRPTFVYGSKHFTTASNTLEIPARKLLNLRFGVEAEQWTVTGYVRNLLDDDTQTANLNFVNFAEPPQPNGVYKNMWGLNPSRGRDWGIELQYRFGD